MNISVIIPAHNAAGELRECLAALKRSSEQPGEVLVVDDGSTDDTAAVAAAMGARLSIRTQNGGPATARNLGAARAGGDILFFVDADVAVAPDGIARVVRTLVTHPEIAAVFGSYDACPRAPGVVSQYRNLLHHYVHQHGRPEAFTFWAGCGAVRRAAFNAVGGFDERTVRHFIEDIEFGHRLRRAGYRILLDRELQGTHLKRWTLGTVVRTDVRYRALPWARLLRESASVPMDLNLERSQRWSVALVGIGLLSLPLALAHGAFVAVAVAAIVGTVILNRKLYGFFRRRRGLAFALACVPLHLLYFLCGGVGFLYGSLVSGFPRQTPHPRS